MTHISHSELNQSIEDARKLVELGAIYKHYKYPERDYKVLGFAIQEATQKVAIIYQDVSKPDSPQFCRDLYSWLENVEWKGEIIPRFRKAHS
jgi:hypothetical protein